MTHSSAHHLITPTSSANTLTLIEAAEAAGTSLFSMATPLPKDGSSPEWVTVFPKSGTIETRDGRKFEVKPEVLMAAFEFDAIEIPVDVNHATDAAGLFGGPAPAVGWGTGLREHDSGLQLRVEWLEEGKSLLAARQYKYTSPSFFREGGMATRIKALSLVTTPALGQQPALARASNSAASGSLAVALGLTAGATEAACLAAISELRSVALPKAEHDTLAARLVSLETSNRGEAVERLLEDALKAMKITPAERGAYAALCATPAGFEQVAQLFAVKVPLLRPSGLDGRALPGDGLNAELPEMLAARAARYHDEQNRMGNAISRAEAATYCSMHPPAGR